MNESDYIPTIKNYNNLPPFKGMVIQQFPFIEEDFDAITNYQLLCKVVEYLKSIYNNNIIEQENITSLYNAYTALVNYIDTYFENLDVQEEINIKLDNMAESGELTALIKGYVDPFIEAQNNRITAIDNKVNKVASGSPLVASSVSGMTDTDRVYVNTSNGYWYYYDGDSWEQGGIYQSSENSNTVDSLENKSNSIFDKESIPLSTTGRITTSGSIGQPAVNTWKVSTYINTTDIKAIEMNCLRYYNILNVAFYDNNLEFVGGIENTDDVTDRNDIILITDKDFPTNAKYVVFSTNTAIAGYYTYVYRYSNANENNFIKGISKLNEVTLNLSITGFPRKADGSFGTGDGSWKRTDFINTENISEIITKSYTYTTTANIAFYDINRNFLGYYGLNITNNDNIVIKATKDEFPEKTKFVVISCNTQYTGYYAKIIYCKSSLKTFNKNYASFGDSITSDQVVGTGTIIGKNLNTNILENFATGFCTCSDWHDGDTNISPVSLTKSPNESTATNVLSNQIRRLIQYTTPLGEQVTWTVDNTTYSIDTSLGTGLGHTTTIPEIIYIQIGTNDGNTEYTPVVDDFDVVKTQSYAELTRNSMASALRWCIETIRANYPKCQIFVASQTQADRDYNTRNGFDGMMLKREIVKKVCDFCSCTFVDNSCSSGIDRMIIHEYSQNNDGIHPDNTLKYRLASFVSNKIENEFFE